MSTEPNPAYSEPPEATLNFVATMLSKAYLRGKLEATAFHNDDTREQMIKAGAETDRHHWCASARALIYTVSQVPPTTDLSDQL